jgi:tetratricopeptide (TPR) repeat protein
VAALYACWIWLGNFREAAERAELALRRATPELSVEARARAHHAAATIAWFRGDLVRTAEQAREALPLARQSGALTIVAYSLLYLAAHDVYQRGELDRAMPTFEEGLELARRLDDPFLLAIALINVGFPAILRGRLDQADAWLGEGLEIARRTGNPWLIAAALVNASFLALARGDHVGAAALCRESLRLRADNNDRWGMIQSFEALAEISAARGDAGQAARLLGVAAGIGHAIGAEVPFVARIAHARTESQARSELGDERFTSAWSEGFAMPLERAVASACE